jgi:hypothetical protein
MGSIYHKTGVSSSNLESPTFHKKSLVLDDLSLRELVEFLPAPERTV